MDLQKFQKEEVVPTIKTVFKKPQEIAPLNDDIVSKLINSETTEQYLATSSYAIKRYKGGLAINKETPPIEGIIQSKDDSNFIDNCKSIANKVPEGSWPLIIILFFAVFITLVYSSSMGIFIGILTVCFVIRTGMNTLVASEASKAEIKQFKQKSTSLQSTQTNLMTIGLAVQDNSLKFHEKNLETIKKCEEIVASANYGQIDATVKRHEEDIKNVLCLTSRIQTGMTNRTVLRNRTLLNAANTQSKASIQIAKKGAETEGNILNSELAINNETLNTDLSIAGLQSSTSQQVKGLETGWKSEMSRRSAQSEKQRILAETNAEIDRERELTDAVRRDCDNSVRQHRQNLNNQFRASYGYNLF